MSGYIDLCRTGYAPFDAVLEAIEDAGDAYHHTSQWQDDDNGEPSHIKRINENINDACIALSNADTIQVPRAEYEASRRDAERYRVKRSIDQKSFEGTVQYMSASREMQEMMLLGWQMSYDTTLDAAINIPTNREGK